MLGIKCPDKAFLLVDRGDNTKPRIKQIIQPSYKKAQEHTYNIESLSKELPEYGWEALKSTIDDERVLIATLRDAIMCRKD